MLKSARTMRSLSGLTLREKMMEWAYAVNVVRRRGPFWNNQVQFGDGVRIRGRVQFQYASGARNNQIVVEDGATLHNLRIRFTGNDSRVIIGKGATWRGYIAVHGPERTVRIGERSTAIDVFIVCRDADITIGADCMFSRGIEVRATDVHKIYDLDSDERLNGPGPVVVGDRVWVAAKATISKRSTVANDTVVGAMSFVSGQYTEPNVVLVGIPARVARRNTRWKR